MARKKPTKRDCVDCENDFYNRNNMGMNMDNGKPECWSFKDAEMVKARDIPTQQPPPYSMPLTLRPNCYRSRGYSRVKPEALDARGHWRR